MLFFKHEFWNTNFTNYDAKKEIHVIRALKFVLSRLNFCSLIKNVNDEMPKMQ